MNTESLKQFRDPAQKAGKDPWKPPLDKELSYRDLIAFDPSLSATGVVALSSTPEGVTVREAYKFPNPETGATGGEDSFRKAMILLGNVTSWRQNCATDVTNWDFVHEAPPVGGGRIRMPESAWLASLAIRSSMWHHLCIGMLQPQRHKFFFSGNGKASKKEHHTAMAAVAEHWGVQGLDLVKNEATRDALSIGLTWLSWEHNVKRLGRRDV
jgi:hypothetical protein